MQIRPAIGVTLLVLLPACGTLTYYDPGDGGPAANTDDPAGDDDDDDGPGDDDDDDNGPGPQDSDPGTTEIPEDCIDIDDCGNPDCDDFCDADGDGVITADLGGGDCDDTNNTIHPGAVEVCDTLDNDCNQNVDGDSDGDGVPVCADCDDADPTRRPGVADYCGDGIDSDCDTADCISWTDGFEAGSLAPVFGATGTLPWTVDTVSPLTGQFSAHSGPIVHLQQSGMTMTVNFPAGGRISFYTSGEAETNYDYLRFVVDGVQQGTWSGIWVWQYAEFLVPAGVHTFGWIYDKDPLVTHGVDRGYIDDVLIEGGTP